MRNVLKSTVATLKTVDGNKASWDRIWSHSLQEYRSLRMVKSSNTSAGSLLSAAIVIRKENYSRNWCYNGNKLRHIACHRRTDKKDKSDYKQSNIRIAIASGDNYQDGFLMDSRASQQISRDMSHSSLLEEIDLVMALLADDRTVSTRQNGSKLLKLCIQREGCERTTGVFRTNVMHIPKEGVNTFSCSQL